MSDDDKIVPLGVKFKDPADESKMLSLVPKYSGCIKHAYVIDPEADEVTCSKCEKKFNPMAVLAELAREESQWMWNYERYKDSMKRLSERSRTKCQHCQRMTNIKA